MKDAGMNGREIEFIPDRLIDEPVVFRGLTDSEVVFIIFSALIFWIPTSIIALIPFGYGLWGVALGSGLSITTLILIGNYLKNLKRRMPDGLHIVYLKKMAQQKISFISFGYIDTSQSWDIRRENPVKKIEFKPEE
jgi:conjugative transfer region protein (TIGR03750 family)